MSRRHINQSSNRLRVLRAEFDLSQMDVADALGCGHNRYWRIENGYQEPGSDELKKLAKLFKRPLSEITDIFAAVAA